MENLLNTPGSFPRRLGLCIAINLLLFFLILAFLKPLFNSGDDAFLMYSFSGAFGTHPTELVDYSWGWHFFLGLLLKSLFTRFPFFNWYSFFLVAIHFFSCVLIFDFFLKRFRFSFAVLMYSFFFIFFETVLILSLGYSSTSIVCAIAANLVLMPAFFDGSPGSSSLILPCLMLLISALLRFHTWVLVEMIFGLFIFFLPGAKAVVYVVLKVAMLIVIVCLYWAHWQYYENRISNWKSEQRVAGVLIDLANSPHSERDIVKDSIEEQFVERGFLYDSVFMNYQALENVARQLRHTRSLADARDRQKIYWTFVNNRIYFFCFFVLFLFLMAKREIVVLKRTLPFLVSTLLILLFLFFFKKITMSIFLGLIMINWTVFCIFYAMKDRSGTSSRIKLIFAPVIAFSFIWMFILIYRVNSANVRNFNNWICVFNDVEKTHSQVLIECDNEFPIDYFSVLGDPNHFRLTNFLSTHMSTMVYDEKKQQLDLRNIPEDIVKRNDVWLIGAELTSLPAYYAKRYGWRVVFYSDVFKHRCAHVYQVRTK